MGLSSDVGLGLVVPLQTDAASTYVLCPHLWNQVSVNFRGSEDNEGDGEQSKDV